MYFSHIRGEDDRLEAAIKEAIAIGERSGAPVQIAHFKAFASPNWGSVRDGLRLVDDAIERGVDVAVDVYPYVAGMGTPFATRPRMGPGGRRGRDGQADERPLNPPTD